MFELELHAIDVDKRQKPFLVSLPTLGKKLAIIQKVDNDLFKNFCFLTCIMII